MPRNRQGQGLKRRYEVALTTTFLNSLNTVCNSNIAAAARLHGVPPSTLRDWVIYPSTRVLGTGCTAQFEPYIEQISDVVSVISIIALPLDRSDIQDLAADMVRTLNLKNIFTNGRPGIDWTGLYKKR